MARVAVVGIGKVGLPLACHLVEGGHEVVVHDKDRALLENVVKKESHVADAGATADVLAKMRTEPSIMYVVDRADVIFIVTPTPLMRDYLSSAPVTEVLSCLEASMDRGAGSEKAFKIAVVVSTLDIRDAEEVCRPRANGRLKVFYNPPLIRLGQVCEDFASAKYIFLGYDKEDDRAPDAVEIVKKIYMSCKNAKPEWIEGDIRSIACAKLAVNATLSARAAWANEIYVCCVKMGLDANVVFKAFQHEARIGGVSYMRPGPPPGGPCLPRDSAVWTNTFPGATIAESIRETHFMIWEMLKEVVSKFVLQTEMKHIHTRGAEHDLKIGIIGVGYKSGGYNIDVSAGRMALETVLAVRSSEKVKVLFYDPLVLPLVAKQFPQAVAASPEEIIDDCHAFIVTQTDLFVNLIVESHQGRKKSQSSESDDIRMVEMSVDEEDVLRLDKFDTPFNDRRWEIPQR